VPFAFPEVKQLRGLYLQQNSFTLPEGAMEEARNVIVKNNFIISSKPGFYAYFDPASGTLNNLVEFEDGQIGRYQTDALEKK